LRSVDDEPRFVVGMDAHAHKLAVLIWDWSDRLNARLHREVKCVDVDAMVKTYERHVDFDSITDHGNRGADELGGALAATWSE